MSQELDLRSAVFSEIDNIQTRNVEQVFVCETDNGILCEIISGNSSFEDKISEMTSAARGLTQESDSVSILHIQPDYDGNDRVGKLKITNPDFSGMDETEQRVRVAHGLTLL